MNSTKDISSLTIDSTSNIKRYIFSVYLISYIWQIVIYFNGGGDSSLIPILMFIPGIIAGIYRLITREGFRNINWGFGNWKYARADLHRDLLLFQLILIAMLGSLAAPYCFSLCEQTQPQPTPLEIQISMRV